MRTYADAPKVARGFSTFMNWFNGVLAPVCGIVMMLSATPLIPEGFLNVMPLSMYDGMPLHDLFFTSHFWPGLALLLVNGVPNVVALLQKKRSLRGWGLCCLIAGMLLIAWTTVEMAFMPNGLSVFYLILGILQLVAAVRLIHSFK